MKKAFRILFTATTIISLLSACGGSNTDSYTVDVNFPGLTDSTKLVISPVTHMRNAENLGEAYLVNGKAQFTGTMDAPAGAFLSVENSGGHVPFILDKGKITISGTVTGEPSERDSTYIIYDYSKVTVAGSEETPRFQHIFTAKDSMFRATEEARTKYRPIMEKYGKARFEKDKALMAEIEASDDFKAYTKAEEENFKAMEEMIHNLINEGKDSYWGPMTMLAAYWYFVPDMRPLYENFSDEAKATPYGQEVKKELYPVGRPGDKLENFESVTSSGDSVSMETVVAGNKYTLIDFWASWCGPCRREIPNLKKIYDMHKNNGFDILSVSIDQEDDAWRKALTEENLPWINCRDTEGDIATAYGVKSIPMLVVVDNEGRLVIENLRGEELENKLTELLTK